MCRDDLPAILRMNGTFRAGLTEGNAAGKFLEDGRNWLFCAVDGGEVVGFAYGYRMARMDGRADMLYIHEVGVAEKFQRRGVGTAMLDALKGLAKTEGIGKMFLITAASNAAANALYRKAGGILSDESKGEDVCYFFPID